MNHTNRCLIITHGFFGDILFASSIAKKLKDENQFGIVDYLIGFPQMKRLMENNPYIDSVFVSERTSPSPVNSNISFSSYDKIVELRPLTFIEPPFPPPDTGIGTPGSDRPARIASSNGR